MSKTEKRWSCPSCTYDNYSASSKCSVCLFPRVPEVIRPPPPNQDAGLLIESFSDFSDTKDNEHQLIICPSDALRKPGKHKSNSTEDVKKEETGSSSELAKFVEEESSKKRNDINVNTDLAEQPWFCGACTFINSPQHTLCSKCRTSKDSTSPSGASAKGATASNSEAATEDNNTKNRKWTCAVCTYINWCSSKMCVMCQNPQPLSNARIVRGTACGGNLSRSMSSSHLPSSRLEILDNRSMKTRSRNQNWLFLKACIGVVEENAEAVDAYLANGGNIARTLTLDEVNLLNRPSAFDVGHTLVHLAIRFQRHGILALLLNPEIAPRGFKRNPAHLSPQIADLIRREIMASLRTRKGDFHCRFLSEFTTFQLPIEICDLPPTIQKLLFNELLDQNVQKELEEECAINWSPSLMHTGDCNSRLYALWNRSAGDCLLDSVLQATWGVFDRDNVLRSAMSESLQDCATSFFRRWREWEQYQAQLLGFTFTERQCLQDWAFINSLAQQPGAALEHCHIFVLAHILRRPIIVYGIKYLKSYRGDTLGFAKFQGVYLPFLWDQVFCYTSPIALGYTRGHFTALVTMENDSKDICAGAQHRNQTYNTIKHLPLVDSDGKVLPIHFTLRGQGVSEDQRKEILKEWLDCHVTDEGWLVARQRLGKRPPSVTRLLDEWLDHYRHMSFRRLGEEGHSDAED
uniref:ubiquitinyl hydrolase 1 n=1 Tax=Ciona intestinalis TaxID=7719 RepID=Q1RL65_CIOIN|nr:Zn-finger (Ran-binding)-3 [Ciona intestinalis]FAA00200.1 TPA: zinc finger protein [Ciona intestinalis]|eukprot:NP_001123331.1 Zn-finger (Ran-binding)-3 [Ciona intestinalis]